jgi:hypothetical protein
VVVDATPPRFLLDAEVLVAGSVALVRDVSPSSPDDLGVRAVVASAPPLAFFESFLDFPAMSSAGNNCSSSTANQSRDLSSLIA